MSEVRLRLPGSRTPVGITLKQPIPALNARETLIRWAPQLKLRYADWR